MTPAFRKPPHRPKKYAVTKQESVQMTDILMSRLTQGPILPPDILPPVEPEAMSHWTTAHWLQETIVLPPAEVVALAEALAKQ
jgi:hypothetical protein